MKSSILLTPPVFEPVTLDELKAHARIEESSDDELLTSLLKAARQWAEAFTRRAFIAQTWALYVSGRLYGRKLVLPKGPLISVSKVQFFDEEDNATDWDETNYYVNTACVPGEIVLRFDAAWPEGARGANGVIVEYLAGYGETAADVPEGLKLAIKQLALHWYENRGEAATSSSYARAPLTIEALLNPYRILQIGGACA